MLGMLHLQKCYFGFWLIVVWKPRLQWHWLTNTVFLGDVFFYLIGDFCLGFWALCYSRFGKSKWVVFLWNKKVCASGSVCGSFLSIATPAEEGRIVTKTRFEFSIHLTWGSLVAPQTGFWMRDSRLVKSEASRSGSACSLRSLFASRAGDGMSWVKLQFGWRLKYRDDRAISKEPGAALHSRRSWCREVSVPSLKQPNAETSILTSFMFIKND